MQHPKFGSAQLVLPACWEYGIAADSAASRAIVANSNTLHLTILCQYVTFSSQLTYSYGSRDRLASEGAISAGTEMNNRWHAGKMECPEFDRPKHLLGERMNVSNHAINDSAQSFDLTNNQHGRVVADVLLPVD